MRVTLRVVTWGEGLKLISRLVDFDSGIDKIYFSKESASSSHLVF